MASGNQIVVKEMSPGMQHMEGKLDTAGSPGMRVKMAADGNYDPVTTAGEAGPILILKENALDGKNATTALVAADQVAIHKCLPGDELNVLLTDLQVVAVGDVLTVATTGKYVKKTGTPKQDDFIALEALSPSGADGLIHVMCGMYAAN